MEIVSIVEKMKLKTKLNQYLNTISNTVDYNKTKKILDAYYFHPKDFYEMEELCRDAGTFDLVQYKIDKFEKYLKENDNKKNENSKEIEEEILERDV